jgi:predicted NUDIX family NTP pyrophosphohydrolase
VKERSAGVLLYRLLAPGAEVLLVHPGGPFWARKDSGSWSIPKGLVDDGEDVLAAARREFAEETGGAADGEAIPLGDFPQKGGKIVTAFAVPGDFDPAALMSNRFTMEWPPRSGRTAEFPEVDRAGWFGLAEAMVKILPGQLPILTAFAARLGLAAGSEL